MPAALQFPKSKTSQIRYSVTQSLCNSLLGDVVLDSFNEVYRDEDSNLDQTYKNRICSYFYYDEF